MDFDILFPVNDEFVKKITTLRGDKGKKWLKDLPETIKQYEKRWSLKVFSPFHLSYNYVAPAKTDDGQNAVLKISFPNNHEFIPEIKALKFFNGDAAIRVLKEDLEHGVVLLEKTEPGLGIRSIPSESERITIVSNVLKKLHKPISKKEASSFPTILDWAKAFDRYRQKYKNSGPIPKKIFEKAEVIFKGYGENINNPVLLHGDLHTDNVLSSKRGWLIIDPKGLVGESEFELGAYLRSPLYEFMASATRKELLTQRIIKFSDELEFDKEKILNWAIACAIISLLWFLEDEGEFDKVYLQNAELLSEIKL